MTYDVVQSASNASSSSNSTISVTLSGCTPGNLIVVVGTCQSANPPSSITFDSGFTTDESIASGGPPGVTAIASRVVPGSPGSSWTVSYATSGDQAIAAIELPPGLASANGSIREVDSTMHAPSITPTAGSDAIILLVGFFGAGYAPTSLSAGYSIIANHFMSNGSSRFFVAKKLVDPTSGSYSATYQAEGNSVIANTIHASYIEAPPVRSSQGFIL